MSNHHPCTSGGRATYCGNPAPYYYRLGILLVFLLIGIEAFAQPFTIKAKKATVAQLFEEIKKQSNYVVMYNNNSDVFGNIKKSDVSLNRVSLETVLNYCLDGTAYHYNISGTTVIISPILNKPTPSKTNPIPEPGRDTLIPVSGRVTSGLDGNPLPGATVQIEGTDRGVTTDETGYFKIQNSSHANGNMLVSFVGFKPKRIKLPLPGEENLTIELQPSEAALRTVEVVSTGYQQIPKERATGSFAFVGNNLLGKRVSTDFISKLEGNVPGLMFNKNVSDNLATTGGYNLSIRGHSTLYANDQPLVIVDGFPYEGSIFNINPNDIENISVLKDAAAASIWGARSANGVIVVTTKKGINNQKIAIEVNVNTTIGDKPDLFYSRSWINATDFIDLEKQLYSQGFYDNDLDNPYRTPVSPVVALLDKASRGIITSQEANTLIDKYRSVDFRKEETKYLYQKSLTSQYNVNLKGGGTNSDYYFSVGYDDNKSNAVGDKSQRFTLNSINNFQLAKGLKLNVGYSYTSNNGQNNSPVSNLTPGVGKLSYYPYAQLKNSDGSTASLLKDYAASYKDTAGGGQYLNWNYSPLDEINNVDNTTKSTSNRLIFGLSYDLPFGLSASMKFQNERAVNTASNYRGESSYYARNLINMYTDLSADNAQGLRNPLPLGGILNFGTATMTSNHLRGQLAYTHHWNGSHHINAIAGAEINQRITESNSYVTYGYDKAKGTNTPVDLVSLYQTNPDGSLLKIPSSTTDFGKLTNRYISCYTNVGYSYKEKYLLSASGRIDKSNLFGVKTNLKSVPLFSTGIGWIFSNEQFYHSKWLPYGKIRATLGFNGNTNTALSGFTTVGSAGNSMYSNLPYSFIGNVGNPELRWEKVRMINLGLDFTVKDQRLSGSFEYYLKKGQDIIGLSPMAPSTGLTTLYGNFSDTKGRGFDLVLNSQNLIQGSFRWSTNLMLSSAKDQVTKYDITATAMDYIIYGDGAGGSIYPLAGKPIFSIYSYQWAGLDDKGNPKGVIDGKPSTDYNRILTNTILDSMIYHGAARPTLFGSLRNTFSYKNFSLSLNILYKGNYYFRRSSVSYSSLYSGWFGDQDYYKRWKTSGDELHTNVPAQQFPPVDSDKETFYHYSSILIEKGDHIRLQDIYASYDFKPKHSNVVRGITVYLTMANVGILWRANEQKLDPDLYANGIPSPRTYSIGLKANF